MDGRLWRGYLLFGLGAVAAYPLLPGGVWRGDFFFDLFGLVAVAAVVWGVWRNRPRHRFPWLLLAAGQGLFVAGDVAFSVYDHVFHQTPFPSAADGLYLAGYPMLAGGLLLLIRRRRPGQDWASLLDASIVAVGLGSVSWALLMAPYLHDRSLSLPGLLISLAYPLADVLLLAVTARLVFGGGVRSVSLWLVGFSLSVLLVTDSIYGWLDLRGAYVSGDAVDIGWIASYALFGAAALHPSMAHASDRVRSADVRFSPWRLALLGLALAAVPVGLAVESLRGDAVNVTMFAVAGMLLIGLTLARLGGVIRANERSIRREALLRQAGSALARASDAEAVYVVGVGAARALAQDARTSSLLALGSPDCLTVVAAADAESARLADHALPVLGEDARLALAGGETVDVPGFALAAKGSPAMMARLCPLFVGDRFRGVLAMQSAGRRLSSQGGDALELLAGRVSLALETQKLTEEVFRRRSEERFHSLVQSSPDIVIRFDSDLRHLYINDAVEAVTGLPPERFVGRTNRDLGMPEELCALFERELGAVFEHGEARRFEFQFDGVDGVRWMEAHVVPEWNAAGEVETVVSFTRDRTEARRAEQEKSASEARYRELFERAMDMIVVLDREGRIVEANPAVSRTLGYERDELIGRPFVSILAPEEADAGVVRFARKLDGSEQASLYQSVLLDKDGRRVPFEANSEVILRDGASRGVLMIARDVSERVALEDQLRHAQKMEAVGRLAGGVAHDFNNLLLVIRGYAELALQKVEARDDSSCEIGEVVAAAEKAASLTAQLLAFSRRQVMNTEILDLREIVGDMVTLLLRLIGEDVELTTVLPDEPTRIHADRGQIEQVIANLAVNARDAMPDGGHLSIEVARAADDGQALLIVRDDGTGMDAATAAQIFEPFFTTKGAEGTGLGLSMVHGIISQNGGQVAVDSGPGQGTTFTITLPLAESVGALPEPVAAAPAVGGAETILLVEDDPVVRRVVTSMLDDHGYRLIPAGSGEEARTLACAAPDSVDLLITDLVMPGLNGRETAEAVRKHQPQVRVLYMSGYTDDAVIRVGGFEPGVSFLQKPFSGAELARHVRELLDSHAA